MSVKYEWFRDWFRGGFVLFRVFPTEMCVNTEFCPVHTYSEMSVLYTATERADFLPRGLLQSWICCLSGKEESQMFCLVNLRWTPTCLVSAAQCEQSGKVSCSVEF